MPNYTNKYVMWHFVPSVILNLKIFIVFCIQLVKSFHLIPILGCAKLCDPSLDWIYSVLSHELEMYAKFQLSLKTGTYKHMYTYEVS